MHWWRASLQQEQSSLSSSSSFNSSIYIEKFTYKQLQLTNRNGKAKTTLTAARKNENKHKNNRNIKNNKMSSNMWDQFLVQQSPSHAESFYVDIPVLTLLHHSFSEMKIFDHNLTDSTQHHNTYDTLHCGDVTM